MAEYHRPIQPRRPGEPLSGSRVQKAPPSAAVNYDPQADRVAADYFSTQAKQQQQAAAAAETAAKQAEDAARRQANYETDLRAKREGRDTVTDPTGRRQFLRSDQEHQAEQAAKAAEEERKARIAKQNDRREQAYRQQGRAFFSDSQGRIRPVADDETFAAEQERKQKQDRQKKRQDRNALALKTAEQVYTLEKEERPTLRQEEREKLAAETGNLVEDAVYRTMQAKTLDPQAKARIEAITTAAANRGERLRLDDVPEDLRPLVAQNAPDTWDAATRSAETIANDDANRAWRAEQERAIEEQRLRTINPRAAKRRETGDTDPATPLSPDGQPASPPPPPESPAEAQDPEARRKAYHTRVADFAARVTAHNEAQAAEQRRWENLMAESEALAAQGGTGEDFVPVRIGDSERLVHRTLVPRLEQLSRRNEAVGGRSDKAGAELERERQALNREAEAVRALDLADERKRRAEFDVWLTKLDQQPDLAPVSAHFRDTEAEIEERRADLEEDFSLSPKERRTALLALEQDRRAAYEAGNAMLEAANEGRAKRAEGMARLAELADGSRADAASLYHRNPETGKVEATDPETASAMAQRQHAAIREIAEQTGISPTEAARAVRDYQDLQFAWQPRETSRVLSAGKIAVNPSLAFDTEGYAAAVENAKATPEAKAQALEAQAEMQRHLGPTVAQGLRTMPHFARWEEKQAGLPRDERPRTEGELVAKYMAERGGTREFTDNARLILRQGVNDVAAQFFAFGGALSQSALAPDSWRERGRAALEELGDPEGLYNDENAALDEALDAAGVPSLAKDIGRAAVSTLPSLAAGGVGIGARGLTAATMVRGSRMGGIGRTFLGEMGRGAGGGVAMRQITPQMATRMAKSAGLGGAGAGAFMQTFGATYPEAIRAYQDQGMDFDTAADAALWPAFASGVGTAALTIGFRKTGVERILQGRNAGVVTARELRDLIAANGGARQWMRTVRGPEFREMSGKLIGTLASDIGKEAIEEGADELMSGLIRLGTYEDNPEATVGEVIEQALHGALIGAALGGGGNVVSQAKSLLPRRGAQANAPSGEPLALPAGQPAPTGPAGPPAASATPAAETAPVIDGAGEELFATEQEQAAPTPKPANERPERVALAADEIAAAQTAGDPDYRRAEAMRRVAAGETEGLSATELAELGLQRDGAGKIVSRKPSKLEQESGPVAPMAAMQGDDVVLTAEGLEWLAGKFPRTRQLVAMDEAQARQYFRERSAAQEQAAAEPATEKAPAKADGEEQAAAEPDPVAEELAAAGFPPGEPIVGARSMPGPDALDAETERAGQLAEHLEDQWGVEPSRARAIATQHVTRNGVTDDDWMVQALRDMEPDLVKRGVLKAGARPAKGAEASPTPDPAPSPAAATETSVPAQTKPAQTESEKAPAERKAELTPAPAAPAAETSTPAPTIREQVEASLARQSAAFAGLGEVPVIVHETAPEGIPADAVFWADPATGTVEANLSAIESEFSRLSDPGTAIDAAIEEEYWHLATLRALEAKFGSRNDADLHLAKIWREFSGRYADAAKAFEKAYGGFDTEARAGWELARAVMQLRHTGRSTEETYGGAQRAGMAALRKHFAERGGFPMLRSLRSLLEAIVSYVRGLPDPSAELIDLADLAASIAQDGAVLFDSGTTTPDPGQTWENRISGKRYVIVGEEQARDGKQVTGRLEGAGAKTKPTLLGVRRGFDQRWLHVPTLRRAPQNRRSPKVDREYTPLLNFLRENPIATFDHLKYKRLENKRKSMPLTADEALWWQNQSDYNSLVVGSHLDRHLRPFVSGIYSKDTDQTPNQRAREAASDEHNILPEGATASDLWEAVGEELRLLRDRELPLPQGADRWEIRHRRFVAEGYDGAGDPWTLIAGEVLDDFAKHTGEHFTKPGVTRAGKPLDKLLRRTGAQLALGDNVTVDGEVLTVAAIDDGGIRTLSNGSEPSRFYTAIVTVAPGEEIYVARHVNERDRPVDPATRSESAEPDQAMPDYEGMVEPLPDYEGQVFAARPQRPDLTPPEDSATNPGISSDSSASGENIAPGSQADQITLGKQSVDESHSFSNERSERVWRLARSHGIPVVASPINVSQNLDKFSRMGVQIGSPTARIQSQLWFLDDSARWMGSPDLHEAEATQDIYNILLRKFPDPSLKEVIGKEWLARGVSLFPEPETYYAPNFVENFNSPIGKHVKNDVRVKFPDLLYAAVERLKREAIRQIERGSLNYGRLLSSADPQSSDPEAGMEEYGGAIAFASLSDAAKTAGNWLTLEESKAQQSGELVEGNIFSQFLPPNESPAPESSPGALFAPRPQFEAEQFELPGTPAPDATPAERAKAQLDRMTLRAMQNRRLRADDLATQTDAFEDTRREEGGQGLLFATRPLDPNQQFFDFGTSGDLGDRNQTAFDFGGPVTAEAEATIPPVIDPEEPSAIYPESPGDLFATPRREVSADGPTGSGEPLALDSAPETAGGRAIEDFGEKIGGARKDRWQDFRDRVVAGLPEDIRQITLSQHWPEPDYGRLIEGGANEADVAAMKALRDLIPRKPASPWKLRRWGEMVKALHEMLTFYVDPDASISDERFLQIALGYPQINRKITLYQTLGHPKFLAAKDYTIGVNTYTMFNGQRYPRGRRITVAEHKGRTLHSLYSDNEIDGDAYGEVAKMISDRIDAESARQAEEPAKKRRVAFGVFVSRAGGEHYIGKKTGSHVDRIQGGFATAGEAFRHIEDHRDELEKIWHEVVNRPVRERNDTNDPRTGPLERTGSVTPEQFTRAFGFRGVEFGNYVEDVRRQQDLNQAYDALVDLSVVLGVPTQALSLDGSLGLAFGARGKGKYAAHYERDYVVINLTKTAGPGSLAHEWFHGVDNYFARLERTGSTAAKLEMDYASETARMKYGDLPRHVRPEVWSAIEKIREVVSTGTFASRSRDLDARKSKPYFSTVREKVARAFEVYVKDRLRTRHDTRNDYLVNVWQGTSDSPYPTDGEMEGGIRQAYDQLFETLATKPGERGTMLFAARPQSTETPAFYSAMERAVETRLPARFTAAQAIATVEGTPGVKAEEIKWSGFRQLVERLAGEGQDGKLAKADLLAAIQSEGRVKFEEVVAGEKRDTQYAGVRFDSLPRHLQTTLPGYEMAEPGDWVITHIGTPQFIIGEADSADDAMEKFDAAAADAEMRGTRETRFQKYQLPGGENYREVVMALPQARKSFTAAAQEFYETFVRKGGEPAWGDLGKAEQLEIISRTPDEALSKPEYTSSHFPDVSNYVAHMRLNERTDAEGRPGLFLEELQSDRHQAGREKGYRRDYSPAEAKRKGELETITETRDFTDSEQAEYDNLRESRDSIPDAPHRKDWPLALFKRALRDAVAGGKEWIGWTVGETQAERYDLSKQVQELRLFNHGDGQWDISAIQKGGGLVDLATRISEKSLTEHVGKDIAQKAIEQQPERGWKSYSGLDLKVGGAGMKGFYDNILPKEIGKYVKQWGAKVEKAEVVTDPARPDGLVRVAGDTAPTGRAAVTTPIWRVSITPAMRETVATVGQPLFAARPRQDPNQRSFDFGTSGDLGTKSQTAFDFGAAADPPKTHAEGRRRAPDGSPDMFEWAKKTAAAHPAPPAIVDAPPRIPELYRKHQRDALAVLMRVANNATTSWVGDIPSDAAVKPEEIDALRAGFDSGKGRVSNVLADLVDRPGSNWNVLGAKVESAEDFFLLNAVFRNPWFESVRVAVLDTEGRVAHAEVLNIGTINESMIDVARIVHAATVAKAKGVANPRVMLSHNHPGGDPNPSRADISSTAQVKEALRHVGATLVDHVITNGTMGYSIAKQAIIDLPASADVAWTVMERTRMPQFSGTQQVNGIAAALRALNNKASYLVALNNRSQLVAVEHAAPDTQAIIAQAAAMPGTYGANRFILLAPGSRDREFFERVRQIREASLSLNMQFVDAVDLVNTTESTFRERGLLEPEGPAYEAGVQPVFAARPQSPSSPSSVTPEQDAEYLAAVESGDMETAQRMVDEAASDAAETFEDAKRLVELAYVAAVNRNDLAEAKRMVDEASMLHMGFTAVLRDNFSVEELNDTQLKEVREIAFNQLSQTITPLTLYKDSEPIILARPGKRPSLRDGFWRVAQMLANGYDGNIPVIEISGPEAFDFTDNISDDGSDVRGEYAEAYNSAKAVVEDQNGGIKSLEERFPFAGIDEIKLPSVTYDESGNIIPLSKRFDPSSDSILFAPTPQDSTTPPLPSSPSPSPSTHPPGETLLDGAINRVNSAIAATPTVKALKARLSSAYAAPLARPVHRVVDFLLRQAVPLHRLDAETNAKMREMAIKQAFAQQEGMDVIRSVARKAKFSDLGWPAQYANDKGMRKRLFLAMQGKLDMATLPAEVQAVGTELRRRLNATALEAVRLGRMHPDTYRDLRDGYMPHYYYDHEKAAAGSLFARMKLGLGDIMAQRSTMWRIEDMEAKDPFTGEDGALVTWDDKGKKVRFQSADHRNAFYSDFIRERAAEQIRARGKVAAFSAETKAQIDRLTPADLNRPDRLTPELRGYAKRVEQEMRVRYRKGDPLTDEEQEKAGLIQDPVYAVAKHIATMAHDNATAEFFAGLAARPDITGQPDTAGYVQLPNNRKLGRLAGQWVKQDVAEEVTQLVDAPSELARFYDGVLAMWKSGKTVYNPGTHVRNVLGNLLFAQMAGVNPLDPRNRRHYAEGWRALRKGGPLLEEMYAQGVLGGDFLTAELRADLAEMLPDLDIETGDDWVMKIASTADTIAHRTGAKKGKQWIEGAYQMEDELFKAASYLRAKAAGMSPEDAAAHTRKWFPYYDQIGTSSAIRAMRRTAMPFFSFQREALRILGHAAAERPASLAYAMAAPVILSAIGAALLGLDEEDYEEIRKTAMRGKGKFFAREYPLFSILLPTRSRDGRLQQLDLTNVMPFASLLGSRLERDSDIPVWQSLALELISGSPLTGIPYEMVSNMDTFSNRPIWEANMTPGEQRAAVAGHVWREMVPPLVPGGSGWNMAAQAGERYSNKSLERRNAAQSYLRALAGIDVRNASPNLYDMAEKFRAERGIASPDYGGFPTSPESRARARIWSQLVQDEPNERAIAKELAFLRSRGRPIETDQDLNRLLFYRNPIMVIDGEENQRAFRRSLAPEAAQVLRDAEAEFGRIQRQSGAILRRARAASKSIEIPLP